MQLLLRREMQRGVALQYGIKPGRAGLHRADAEKEITEQCQGYDLAVSIPAKSLSP